MKYWFVDSHGRETCYSAWYSFKSKYREASSAAAEFPMHEMCYKIPPSVLWWEIFTSSILQYSGMQEQNLHPNEIYCKVDGFSENKASDKVFWLNYSPLMELKLFSSCFHFRIQELASAENHEEGRVPRTIECELTEDLVDCCIPGETVTVTGIVKVLNNYMDVGGGTIFKKLMLFAFFFLNLPGFAGSHIGFKAWVHWQKLFIYKCLRLFTTPVEAHMLSVFCFIWSWNPIGSLEHVLWVIKSFSKME